MKITDWGAFLTGLAKAIWSRPARSQVSRGTQVKHLPPLLCALLLASAAPAQVWSGGAGAPIGTSGATIPLNNGNNTTSGNNTHNGTETFNGAVTLPSGTAAANMSIIDPRAWGMAASAQNTTGSISVSSNTLSLTTAIDFANGQGIRINHAGAAVSLGSPTSCSATAAGTTGSTTYDYEVAPVDAAGGVGAATASFSVTNGNATLSVLNYVAVACTAPSGTPAGYAVYRNNGSAYVLVGVINNATPTYYDMGYGVSVAGAPDYLPTVAPASSLADWLVTSVSSGAGTTALTLGAAASTAQSGAAVYHDDTAALNVAVAQAQLSNNNAVNLPPGQMNVTGSVPITNAQFRLQGFGWGSTIFRVNATGDLFTFTGGKALISDIFFQANALQSSGYYLNLGPNGNNTVRNIRAYGGPGIIDATGGGQNLITQFLLNNFTHTGINWSSNAVGTDTVTDGTLFVEPQITIGHAESRGFSIAGGITFMLANLNFGGQDLPCYIKPGAGISVHDIDVSHVQCDGQGMVGPSAIGGPGWTIDGSNSGAKLTGLRFTAAWAGTMSQDGFYVNSVDTFACGDCDAEANRQNGFNFTNVHNVTLSSPKAYGNDFGATTTYDGIFIDSTSSNVALVGGRSGSNRALPTATQRYGINVATGSYQILICGMISFGNVTSSYFVNGSTTAPSCANY